MTSQWYVNRQIWDYVSDSEMQDRKIGVFLILSSVVQVSVSRLAAQISRLTTQGTRPRNGEHFYEREECNKGQMSNDTDLPNWLQHIVHRTFTFILLLLGLYLYILKGSILHLQISVSVWLIETLDLSRILNFS